jgi:hypothetical protein
LEFAPILKYSPQNVSSPTTAKTHRNHGYDQIEIDGGLFIESTSDHPFIVDITPWMLTDEYQSPSTITNCCVWETDANPVVSWVIARTSGGVAGFSPDRLELKFGNVCADAAFRLSVEGKDLVLSYVPQVIGRRAWLGR